MSVFVSSTGRGLVNKSIREQVLSFSVEHARGSRSAVLHRQSQPREDSHSRRSYGTLKILDPKEIPNAHTSSPWTMQVQQCDQRRTNVNIADLDKTRDGRERVVILGSGWGGYPLSKKLDHKKYQVVIVSPRSYFVFTPLLASTSVGTLEFRTALEPIRNRRSKTRYIQGWADDVDLYNKTITIEEAVADPHQGLALTGDRDEGKDQVQIDYEMRTKLRKGRLFDLRYDKLVISVGSYSQTFGTTGVREHANFLKDVGDARKIRKRLLECFEMAALPTTTDEVRRQILHFAIVGGGPTGIEFSAELHDLLHTDMTKIYPELIQFAKITLYDVSPKVLNMFDAGLQEYATDAFSRRGIDIKTSRRIMELANGLPGVDPEVQAGRPGLTLKVKDEEDLGIGMCIWSTGLMMNPFIHKALSAIRRFPPKEVIFKESYQDAEVAQWHIARDAKTGSIMTNDRLRVMIDAPYPNGDGSMKAHLRDVFAIGDCSFIQNTMYPATAQVANQKADWLAKSLNANDLHGDHRFRYNNLGIMAYIGNAKAIVMGAKGVGNMSGTTAWLMWRGVYLSKSISWRNRILIPMYWFLNWAFGRDISRF
ncbi:hypothetical protein K402DRAFT_394679 [Aulographum hederae CBS 113979]|uniref:Uncharacterized protein n=1 Tax=Aulographum hederae CBS 113979 TaxID=1176131 RepID=A0A6G1GWM8_9PEZI|nr:hypothetical protein K402DRAFT_394679 [Aulographum hederae CBS 113979]